MTSKQIIETVRRYSQAICSRHPIRRVFLYGSHVRGMPRPDSDIDVAVVMKKTPEDKLQAEADLFRIGMDIDVRIEPIIVDEENDPSGFYEQISRYGKVIYKAP